MSSVDPYAVLGVRRDASQKEIQKSYRRLAKKLHPDLNPGNREAEQKFKEVTAAYDLLSDPEKRARFDRGEIDASGTERPRERFYRDFADGAGQPLHERCRLRRFRRGRRHPVGALRPRRRRSTCAGAARMSRYRLEVDFLDAVNGATRRLTLPDGAVLDVAIPPGTRDGQVLRLRGKGRAGSRRRAGGRRAGRGSGSSPSLLLAPGRRHSPRAAGLACRGGARRPGQGADADRSGDDDRAQGCQHRHGAATEGQGRPARQAAAAATSTSALKVVLPEKPDPELESFVAEWPAGKTYNPRQAMEA